MEPLKYPSLMIIDDDADDRSIFTESVRKVNPGLECLQASNGMDGIEKLLQVKALPQYVFVDVNMPNMSGFDVLLRIRGHEKLKDIKVIIYTTSNQKSTMETARNLGADGFLTKPEELSELVSYISKLVNTPATRSLVDIAILAILYSFFSLAESQNLL